MNGYAVTAQFYDAMAGDQHAGVDAQIAAALKGLDTNGHPIVDIGAGTGLTTRTIAQALPEAEILAVEPDPAMRPALMTRIWSDPELRRRVSILPMSILEAPLPSTIAAAVASASLVHFGPQERKRLWSLLVSRLCPHGRVVVEVQCPAAVDVPESCLAKARIGRVDYEGWVEATRIDGDRQHWRMTYVARLQSMEIDRQHADYACWAISGEQILSEAQAFGLTGAVAGDLVVLRQEDGQAKSA